MRTKYDLLVLTLRLFDGGAAAAGGEGGDTGTGSTAGETQAAPAAAGRGKKTGETQRVVYGKQATSTPAAGEESEVKATSSTQDEKRKAYRALVDGEYREQYAEDTQHIVRERFKETKALQQQVDQYQTIVNMLLDRYKLDGTDMSKLAAAIENDDAYWSEAAEEAGLSVEQYKQLRKLQRENAQLLQQQRKRQGEERAQARYQEWIRQADQAREVYPSFDLSAEVKDPRFMSLLQSGVPVQHAYEVVHMEEIKAGIAQMQAKATEKQVAANIRARGQRPAENGTSAQSAFTVKDDVSKLTAKDRAEIARRVARGEHIEF